ncbi:MAG: glycosyltransferase family 4 protein [Bacteroides sp.]|nr:glycosyltransferase family 4 protein [Bacteroides sp.]
MKKILVFGYFGYLTNKLDGQTVKTRAVYKLMQEREDTQVRYADSQVFRSSPMSILRFVRDLFWCDTLIWLPAHNNLRMFFRPLMLLSRLAGFSIIYIVIGGWLSEILKGLSYHRKHLGEIQAILVENQTTVSELQNAYGYTNLAVIPNFRFASPRVMFNENKDGELKLVFMARIDENKGLETIGKLCEHSDLKFSVDFYGPINPDHADFFNNLLAKHSNLTYKGKLQPEEINDTLIGYDAMLLPTKYYTEGLPGSIVDAYMAGLPVLVSRWKHASEFVVERVTGYIGDFNNPEPELASAIRILTADRELLNKMKHYAAEEAVKYTTDAAKVIINRYL